MSAKIKYTDEPLGKVQMVPDFLPSPAELAFREEGVKVTLALSKKSIEFFKSEATKHQTQYQRLLSRMSGKLPRRLQKEKLGLEDALAIQMELEDEHLQEWRKMMAILNKKNAAKAKNKSAKAATEKPKGKTAATAKTAPKTAATAKAKSAAKPTAPKARTPAKRKSPAAGTAAKP